MSINDWIGPAVGAGFGILAAAILIAVSCWIRKTADSRACPLCGHQPAAPPARSFSDGAAQLGEQLDRQKEQQ